MNGRSEDNYIIFIEVKKFGYEFIIYIKVPIFTGFREFLDLTVTLRFEI